MTIFRFEKFVFDTENLELRANGVLLAMRPKTAVLMSVLITQRQQLLSKQALFSQVWQSEHVQHQSLFQAISEIRKLLAPLQPIKTHPNLGYQWVAPVKQVNQRAWLRRATGALLSVVSISTVLIWQLHFTNKAPQTPAQNTEPQTMLFSPAMQAFSNGIEHLHKHQLSEAREYFELAERENPLFLEASMMKAEIFFEQGDFAIAKDLANQLLLQAENRDDRYIEVSAQSLLSRISEQSGQWNSAMDWALKADSNARSQGFACVAEHTKTRISGLRDDNDLPANPAMMFQEPNPGNRIANDDEYLTIEYPDSSHCKPIQKTSESDETKPDLSQCLDTSNDYLNLAIYQSDIVSSYQLS